MYSFEIKHFNELTAREFHDILQLRINVFIIEQNCPYPELDNKDLNAFHVLGKDYEGKIVATSRILAAGVSYDEVSIGRVSNDLENRNKGLGSMMMKAILDFIKKQFPGEAVRISAQSYLLKFYESHGFVSTGKEYLEDDIPHVEMLLGN